MVLLSRNTKSYWFWTAVAVGFVLILAFGKCAIGAECLSSASEVWASHHGAHATWRLRVPGHEGTKCWMMRGDTIGERPHGTSHDGVDHPRRVNLVRRDGDRSHGPAFIRDTARNEAAAEARPLRPIEVAVMTFQPSFMADWQVEFEGLFYARESTVVRSEGEQGCTVSDPQVSEVHFLYQNTFEGLRTCAVYSSRITGIHFGRSLQRIGRRYYDVRHTQG
jgi:hypothetical protein